MPFEKPSYSSGEEEPKESEKAPDPSSLKERVKYYAKIAAMVGATSLFTVEDISDSDEQQYEAHLDELLDVEKREYVDSLYTEIRSKAGDGAVQEIQKGDKAAFALEPLEEREPASFYGFEDSDLNEGVIESMLSDDFFPKNWIDGEIESINYIDQRIKSRGKLEGEMEGGYIQRENAVLLFKKDSIQYSEDSKEFLPWAYKYTFAHESAHANDWKTDKDLNIIERAELLSSVLDRMESENPYSIFFAETSKQDYYERYLDGTKEGRRRAAREYWAEICKMYFSDPRYLKDEFPEDFELVHKYVSKQDSDFDPFESGGPYFSAQTGELLPEWQEYLDSLPKK